MLLNNKRLATELTLFTSTVRYHCNPNVVSKPTSMSLSKFFLPLCAGAICANEFRERRLRWLS